MNRLVFAYILVPVVCLSQQTSTITVSVTKVMTPQEMMATGVVTLTPAQRTALDGWLTAYTLTAINFANKPTARPSIPSSGVSQTYIGTGGGHWIKTTASNGAIITLEDGSIWDIQSIDRIDTSLWLTITDITVLKAQSPIGEYKCVLLNTEDGEKALAKYLGKE